MRLQTRLNALTQRVPPVLATEDAMNRVVFALHRRETEEAFTATPPLDYDAYREECERLLRDVPDFVEQWHATTADCLREEEAAYGLWMIVPGHGLIRERTYVRLRAQVTGGRDAADDAP